MKRRPALLCIGFLTLWFAVSSQSIGLTHQEEIMKIGNDRQLFVDHYLIDSLSQADLKLHRPRDEGPVLYFDQPWEGPFSGYCTIIKDDDSFKAFYRGLPMSGNDGNSHEVTCYAESDDGITWRKPNVNLHEVKGSSVNNVILANAAPVTHNFSPFLDSRKGIPADEKFKALGGTEKSGLIAFKSADGIHWTKMQAAPVITDGKFDSQNVAFWSETEQKYISYFRIWTEKGYSGYRSIGRATSDDFIHWSSTTTMNFGATPTQHLYTNQTHPYFRAPQIYIAIAARFMPNRQVVDEQSAIQLGVNPKYYKDCSDAVFLTSRGGDQYDRTFMESFIRPGIGLENWVSRTNYPALNVVQTSPTEMSIYVNQDYAQATAHLHRYTLRLDGFTSVSAPFRGGEMITKPFVFSGDQLLLNFATSAAGSVQVEILDENKKPIEGFTLEDCYEMIGNEIEREVRWNNSKRLRELVGQPVRLRFALVDADLYAFRFGQQRFPKLSLLEVNKIWEEAPHNAFTDLIYARNRWFCVFREGTNHISPDGTIRIISSPDGEKWESTALLISEDADLRDAKISETPAGKLMINGAGALRDRSAHTHQSMVWFSDDGLKWEKSQSVADPNYWLWRVHWHQNKSYGFGYATGEQKQLRLYESKDGINYRTLVSDLGIEGYPNETSIVFKGDTAICLLRRDGATNHALLGSSLPPYEHWDWKDLGRRIGGPDMILLPNGKLLTTVRLYEGKDWHPARTSLCWIDLENHQLIEALRLPSGGDTSYAGMVLKEGILWISYYSSHEGKTAIYLAKVGIE